MKKNKLIITPWVLVGLLWVMIAVPNATIAKEVTGEIDPVLYVALRYVIVSIVCLPFVIKSRKLINARRLRDLVVTGVFMVLGVICYAASISLGQASYTSIISLLDPILLVVLSAFLLREKITRGILSGVLLAAVGATVVAVAPFFADANQLLKVDVLSVVLALLNCLFYVLMIINMRRINMAGVPIMATVGYTAIVAAIIASVATMSTLGDQVVTQVANVGPTSWLAILYVAILVGIAERVIGVKLFERIGAAMVGNLMYIQTFLCIIFPMMVLGERLTVEIIVGVCLIFVGVVVTEKVSHRSHHVTKTGHYKESNYLHHLHRTGHLR
jgi:drug/metabolite transporter (DMT)-like permease